MTISARVRSFLVVALALVGILSSACSADMLPTSPTAVTAVPAQTTVAPSATSQTVSVMGMPLSWEHAEGCPLQKPALQPEVIRGVQPAMALPQGSALMARWLDPNRPAAQLPDHCVDDFMRETRKVEYYLQVTFKAEDGAWQFCSWDTASKEILILEATQEKCR